MTYEYQVTKHPAPKDGQVKELEAPDGWELGDARLDASSLVCLWVRRKSGPKRASSRTRP